MVRLTIGTIVFGLIAVWRQSYALTGKQQLFAEDGLVAGLVTSEGLFNTIFYRSDYPMALATVLHWLSQVINTAVYGNELINIASTVAIVSYVYYGFAFTCITNFSQELLGKRLGIFVGLAIALQPLGNSSNEIFGRLLQVHFLSPLLVIWAARKCEQKNIQIYSRVALLALVVILLLTSPINILIYFLYILISAKNKPWLNDVNKETRRILVVVGIVCMIIVYSNVNISTINPMGVYNERGLIEMITARCTLAPFMGDMYGLLNNNTSIILTLLVWSSWINTCKNEMAGNRDEPILALCLLCTFVVYMVGIMKMRYGLTQNFGEYKYMDPARYFWLPNTISIILTTWVTKKYLYRCNLGWQRSVALIIVPCIGIMILWQISTKAREVSPRLVFGGEETKKMLDNKCNIIVGNIIRSPTRDKVDIGSIPVGRKELELRVDYSTFKNYCLKEQK